MIEACGGEMKSSENVPKPGMSLSNVEYVMAWNLLIAFSDMNKCWVQLASSEKQRVWRC
jgi:hypothetical protein